MVEQQVYLDTPLVLLIIVATLHQGLIFKSTESSKNLARFQCYLVSLKQNHSLELILF